MDLSIAIVGGGCSGLSVLHSLIERLPTLQRSCVIHWFENSDRIGPGLAWGNANSQAQLFNSPAGVASISVGGYGAFLGWCKNNGIPMEFGAYPPRSLFGKYTDSLVEVSIVTMILQLVDFLYSLGTCSKGKGEPD